LCGFLARTLGWHLLDSGALYRALALSALVRGLNLDNCEALSEMAVAMNVVFEPAETPEGYRVLQGGVEIGEEIRTEKCGGAASQLAALEPVRAALLTAQRAYRTLPGLVADGRDMGTVVFPDAQMKLFLTASLEERAKRRYKQLKEKGISVNLPRLSADIAERDTRDQERTASPMRPAADAIVVDTTSLDAEQVRRKVWALVRERFPESPEAESC
jgi:cytidylate kinase